jgi:outer membrane lipoprotein-sorting protein
MIRKFLLILVVALLGTTLWAQSADEIVSKYLAARGGIDKIRAVKSERVIGTITFGSETNGPFVVERKRPLKMHMEISFGEQKFIRVYDGKSAGWTYNPFVPSPSVESMPESELRNILDEADFDGPFVDYKSKGNRLEFVDKEEVLGKTAYKIKLTSKIGEISHFYFDASTGLLLKWEGDRNIAGKNVPWESFFHDFREVDGLKYPFLIESDAPGTDQTQKISADKIEVNVAIPDSRFEKPTPPPVPAANSPAQPPPNRN